MRRVLSMVDSAYNPACLAGFRLFFRGSSCFLTMFFLILARFHVLRIFDILRILFCDNFLNLCVHLYRMQKLIASKNNISDLPSDLWKMKSLEVLDISDNLLGSLPESIAKLPSIKELRVDVNKIGSFPTAVQTLQGKGVKIDMHSQDQTKQKRYMEQSIAQGSCKN